MRLTRLFSAFVTSMAIAGISSFIAVPALAGAVKDTPERLMARAKSYSTAEAKKARSLGETFFVALSTEKEFATRVLEAAQKEDKNALAELIGKKLGVSPSQVEIEEVDKDILIKGTASLHGGTVIHYCVDTEDKRCRGHGWSVGVSGM